MELSNQGGTASGSWCSADCKKKNTGRQGEDRARKASKQVERREGQTESGADMAGDNLTEDDIRDVYVKQQKYVEMEREDSDDGRSDSGLVTEFSAGCAVQGDINGSAGNLGASTIETPIEKEIRRSIEREQSLRRSRGLPNLRTSPEYVELNLRKNVLSQSLATKSQRLQGKDRQFAGKKMQQDIYEEAQREEDLVRIGKVPGFYDKGTVRQLKEKKHVFEAFQKPSDSTVALSRRKTTCLSSSSDSLTLDDQKDVSSRAPLTKDSYRRSVDLTDGHTSASGGSNGTAFSEGLRGRNITTTDSGWVQKSSHYQQEVNSPDATFANDRLNRSSFGAGGHGGITRLLQENDHEMEEEEEEVPRENPFFKLRSSSNIAKVQEEIHAAQEREKELRNQRISLYGGALVKDMPPSMTASHGPASADLADSAFGSEPSAGQQSAGRLIMWPPPSVREERTSQPENQLHQRSWTSRRKNPLVQRWESGQINGHQEEED